VLPAINYCETHDMQFTIYWKSGAIRDRLKPRELSEISDYLIDNRDKSTLVY
jgi:hypothetical protein